MAQKKLTIVTAVQKFFSEDPHGRHVEIPEFKELTTQDKIELSEMLNKIPGFEHEPYLGPSSSK